MTQPPNTTMPGRARSPIPRGRKKKKSKERDVITEDERRLIDDFLANKAKTTSKKG